VQRLVYPSELGLAFSLAQELAFLSADQLVQGPAFSLAQQLAFSSAD
jgi:hypothetical protein